MPDYDATATLTQLPEELFINYATQRGWEAEIDNPDFDPNDENSLEKIPNPVTFVEFCVVKMRELLLNDFKRGREVQKKQEMTAAITAEIAALEQTLDAALTVTVDPVQV